MEYIFTEIDLKTAPFIPKGMTKAYSNLKYVVMVYENAKTTHGLATKVLIRNFYETPIVNHWSEIQKIKNEIFGKETVAVEYYPAESELINEKNIYWIWIYPKNVLPIAVFE